MKSNDAAGPREIEMNQQQIEHLEMRLTRIENQLTHILRVLLGTKSDSLEAFTSAGESAEQTPPLTAAITGLTTRRVLTPSRGGKYSS